MTSFNEMFMGEGDETLSEGPYDEPPWERIIEPRNKLKYSPGTKLKVLCDGRNEFNAGDILIVTLSRKYPYAYDFEGLREVGWKDDYIENPNYFIKISNKITNWRERII